jgi:hypothetical protein
MSSYLQCGLIICCDIANMFQIPNGLMTMSELVEVGRRLKRSLDGYISYRRAAAIALITLGNLLAAAIALITLGNLLAAAISLITLGTGNPFSCRHCSHHLR